MMNAFLETATRIGHRVVQSAQWTGDECSWSIRDVDRRHPTSKRSVATVAGGSLYQGTAGIALFLAELSRVSGSTELGRTVSGAMKHAVRFGAKLPPNAFGFYAGRVGIAYAALRTGEVLSDPSLMKAAADLLRPLVGREAEDRGLDVISGAAGAIPVLLEMGSREELSFATQVAESLGEWSIQCARKEWCGWSWDTVQYVVRNLTGFAHGASGFAYGLLELYNVTADAKYRYAAEQALLYERRFLNREVGNWPDFRYRELSDEIYEARTADLRERLSRGERLRPWTANYMTAWCHGAAGIGLTRLRGWQLLSNEVLRSEAEVAVRTTAHSLRDMPNFSLCHGAFGNCETLLLAEVILGDAAWRREVCELSAEWCERFELSGTPFPCGVPDGMSDPSLMLGEAGIGHSLLRLYSADVSSVLFIHTADVTSETSTANSDETVKGDYVAEYFDTSLRAVKDLAPGAWQSVIALSTRNDGGGSDVEAVADALRNLVGAAATDAERVLLEDATMCDLNRFELSQGTLDFTEEFLDTLRNGSPAAAALESARFRLAGSTRIVHPKLDWAGWVRASCPPSGPEEMPESILLFKRGNRIRQARIGRFPVAVLEAIGDGTSLDELVARVSESVRGSVDTAILRDAVIAQLLSAIAGRLALVEEERPTAASRTEREALTGQRPETSEG